MSQHVRAWLIELHMLNQTTHEERVEIDKEIERRTGMNCDDALIKKKITRKDFVDIVNMILKRKKTKKEIKELERQMVV